MHDLQVLLYMPFLVGGGHSTQKQMSLFSELGHKLKRGPVCGSTRAGRNDCSKPMHSIVSLFTTAPTSVAASSASSPSYSTMAVSDDDPGCSPAAPEGLATRVPLPLPFSQKLVKQGVEFSFRGRPGVSLADWIRLSEKGKTHLCLDDPSESLDEVVSESQILYQCQWPGYDTHTRYLPLPDGVVDGSVPFTKADLLDMVCKTLADWILMVTRCKQIECTERNWAIGLDGITFKHVYVASVIEVKGYIPKWVPVLEIDPTAFR
ncbi:hypothetical protein BV20DRAFT_795047 [Pilatotrama ljubarskyi]|nr:hypothetical protein BV20DRAFT_795047 [Pilatotrama ljubarskyi]